MWIISPWVPPVRPSRVSRSGNWERWTPFPQLTDAYLVRAATPTDGRPQIQGAADPGPFSTWKPTRDPNAGWAPWTNVNGPPGAVGGP